MSKLDRKIVYSSTEPNTTALWLHYKEDRLTLEFYGTNGWESINEHTDISNLATTQEVDDFEEFSENTTYVEGDIVRKDGKLYVFTAEHEGEWDADDVNQTSVVSILTEMIMDAVPKPFRLLKAPTEEMTTLEELATTGITKEAIIDMVNGKYSRILNGSYSYSIIYATVNEDYYYLIYGYDLAGTIKDTQEIYDIEIDHDVVSIIVEER